MMIKRIASHAGKSSLEPVIIIRQEQRWAREQHHFVSVVVAVFAAAKFA
jgi:hypothetical protein